MQSAIQLLSPPRAPSPPPAAGCTFGALALGRFVFLPFHRASLAKAGMPEQNGQTHAQAGDIRAEEASFVLKTNDPAGGACVRGGSCAWGWVLRVAGGAALCVCVCVWWTGRKAGCCMAAERAASAPLAIPPPTQPINCPPARPPTHPPTLRAGFTLVDVAAWGALGHAAAFYLLATASLQNPPVPF
jgi:photosystem I subunit V